MSTGGKRLNELIKKRGFRIGAVAEAIGVGKNTISTWGNNAPIGKLVEISEFADIPLRDVLRCFIPDIDQLIPDDRIGGENN
jgi:transcriptional regulator with XRE-family HTH domain